MFAKTVYMDNERQDPGHGTQYEGQQKTRSDGGVFSLQADDRSMTSSPTTPAAWKQTPSIRSASTQATVNDKDKNLAPYKPTTARVSESPEQASFPNRPASLSQTSESIEEHETESEYAPRHVPGPPLVTVSRPRGGSRVIEVGPTESGVGFGSGDSESDRERQQGRQQRRGQ